MSDLVSSPESGADPDLADSVTFGCALRHSGHDAAWIRVRGELDLAGAPELERCLDVALTDVRLAVVDLRQLVFMDGGGVRVIVNAHNRAVRTGRRLVLIRGRAQVTRLLDLAGLNNRLEIVDLDTLTARPGSGLTPVDAA